MKNKQPVRTAKKSGKYGSLYLYTDEQGNEYFGLMGKVFLLKRVAGQPDTHECVSGVILEGYEF